MRRDKEAIKKKVYKAIPDDATWDDLADGIEISFNYRGKKYSFSSKVCSYPRTTPIQTYMDRILEKGVECVEGETNDTRP